MIRSTSLFFLTLLTLIFSVAQASVEPMTINGAGATFPYPIYSKWMSEYQKVDKSVRFNYQSIGSGGGVRQILNQTVDFGASDDPLSDADMKSSAEKGWPLVHIPTVIGSVTIAYNLPSISERLKLDGKTLAEIFLRKITKWNDPKIAALNAGVILPDADILVVRRADGSGTTAVFADYLSTVSPDWKKAPGRGKSLRWPAGAIGARGNEGVTAMVKQTVGAIGYIELAYAIQNDLPTALMKNRAGEFQAPTVKAVSKSAEMIKDFSGDLRMSIVDAEGAGVYPISAFTYILIPEKEEADEKLAAVKKFLVWALTDGQDFAEELHYSALPEALRTQLVKKLTP